MNDASRASGSSKPTLPKQTLLPNLPTLSRGLPLPQCLSQQSFSSTVQTHRQHLLPILPTLPIPTLPAVPEPALFHQRVPSTTFPAWPGQSGVQPVFVEKSALPIFPDGPPAAQICAADLSRRWHGCHRPDIQTSSPLRQALDCPVPRSRERCRIASQPPRRRAPGGARGGTNRSDMGLNLSGSWQQGHSATYNTPSRI